MMNHTRPKSSIHENHCIQAYYLFDTLVSLDGLKNLYLRTWSDSCVNSSQNCFEKLKLAYLFSFRIFRNFGSLQLEMTKRLQFYPNLVWVETPV